MQFHPLADIFPLMPLRDLQRLADDIAGNGQLEPIILYEGKILDGRNRFLALHLLNREPHFETWEGRGDALAFVLSRNLHRRHLVESQRSMVAARLANLSHGEHPHRSGVDSAQVVTAQGSEEMPIGMSQNETQLVGHLTVVICHWLARRSHRLY